MSYFLKQTRNKKGTYLQIYESTYDPGRGYGTHPWHVRAANNPRSDDAYKPNCHLPFTYTTSAQLYVNHRMPLPRGKGLGVQPQDLGMRRLAWSRHAGCPPSHEHSRSVRMAFSF